MAKLKIALTGHTRGLGENIYKCLDADFVVGSRSNGYDICSPEDRSRFVTAARDCDVFINNARGEGLAQSYMLYDIFETWRNERKTIININSLAAIYSDIRFKPHIYSVEKRALQAASRQLQNCERRCRITDIYFGYVATPEAMRPSGDTPEHVLPIDIAHQTIERVLDFPAPIAAIEIWHDKWWT